MFSLFTLVLIFSFFGKSKKIFAELSMNQIILFGLAFNLFVGAIFSVIQFLFMAMNFEFPSSLWFGSLKEYEVSSLYIFATAFIVTKLILLKLVDKFEVLNLGSSFAYGLGVNVAKVQKMALILSFFLTGLVITYFGVFSFLGLIFPHILRSFKVFKTNMNYELIYGPYLTALIFGIVDQVCYQFDFHGAELPVGMVSSVFGAMFLIVLVLKEKLYKR